MAFVKWGFDYKSDEPMKTSMSIDGVPVRRFLDMADDRKRLIGLVEKLLTCCDEERDAAVMQEAHSLLERIKGGKE